MLVALSPSGERALGPRMLPGFGTSENCCGAEDSVGPWASLLNYQWPWPLRSTVNPGSTLDTGCARTLPGDRAPRLGPWGSSSAGLLLLQQIGYNHSPTLSHTDTGSAAPLWGSCFQLLAFCWRQYAGLDAPGNKATKNSFQLTSTYFQKRK